MPCRKYLSLYVREPLLVLDSILRVVSANPSFYATFAVSETQTEGRFIYELGNGQWDIPELRKQLEEVLPGSASFDDFRVDHLFEEVGQRSMLINARKISGGEEELILLAIADITALDQH